MKKSMMLKPTLLLFILLVLCTTSIISQEKQTIKEISSIAERDLKIFLENIPIGMEANYGFSDRKEFEKASLGKPISILFPTEYFYSSAPFDSSKTNYEISPIWEVPIRVNGNIRCLLRLKNQINDYSLIGIGGSLTAIEIDRIMKEIGLDTANEICMINFPELKCQYLIVDDNYITYKNSKCYKIGNLEKSESKEISLLNVLVSSKLLIKERKDIGYGQ